MIQIKNPCDADWQQMTSQTSGKFCAACEKVVVDFSSMNDTEIKDYFIAYKEQKTCGRFLTTQLDRPLKSISRNFFTRGIDKLNQISSIRAALLLITSMSVWISGCVKNNDMTTGKSMPLDSGSTSTTPLVDDTTLIIKDPNNVNVLPPDSKKIMKMGEVAPHQTTRILPAKILMGDVAVSPEADTVRVNIPDKPNCVGQSTEPLPENDIHLIKGKVMMVDTISQKIKKRK